MNSRISDPRILSAQSTGTAAGVPDQTALQIALVADLLLAMATWSDMHFMFDGLAPHRGQTFKVPVEGHGWTLFEWSDGLGAINLRLLE